MSFNQLPFSIIGILEAGSQSLIIGLPEILNSKDYLREIGLSIFEVHSTMKLK